VGDGQISSAPGGPGDGFDVMTTELPRADLPLAVRQRVRRYRVAALVILLLGLAGAGTLYWLKARPLDYSSDPALLGFDRAERQQMGVLYGKQGELVEELDDTLRKPGTQASLIILGAAVVALGCFQFSRVLELEARAGESGSNLPASR
jgi:hypothetical protein